MLGERGIVGEHPVVAIEEAVGRPDVTNDVCIRWDAPLVMVSAFLTP